MLNRAIVFFLKSQGSLVAVGTQQGLVQVWDATAGKQVSTLHGHTARVGAIAWNGDLLSSGSRDRFINQKDIRAPPAIPERQLVGHRQEVTFKKIYCTIRHNLS